MVASCGGGGGGGGGGSIAALPSSTSTTPAASTPTATTTTTTGTGSNSAPSTGTTPESSTIIATVTPSNYAAGSEQAAAFALLNAERTACGFGALSQNTQLDTAAAGHAKYLLADNYAGHYQAAGTANFTGNGPLDRATAAGYNASLIYDLNTSVTGIADITGRGVFSVRSLLSAPYHLADFTQSMRDVGISIMSSDQAGSTAAYGPRSVEQFDLATTPAAGEQLPSSSDVLTYPCASSTGTFFEVVNESPNPVPGRDLLANPLGQPVYVFVRPGQTLTIASAKMNVGSATGAAVALRTPMTSSNDPNLDLTANQALIIPDVALTPSTSYFVSITGTNNGVNFTKSFSFTTGTGTGRT